MRERALYAVAKPFASRSFMDIGVHVCVCVRARARCSARRVSSALLLRARLSSDGVPICVSAAARGDSVVSKIEWRD